MLLNKKWVRPSAHIQLTILICDELVLKPHTCKGFLTVVAAKLTQSTDHMNAYNRVCIHIDNAPDLR